MMLYLVQWIIVGVACYSLRKIERNKYLPKFHLGMLAIQRAGTKDVTPEMVVSASKVAETVCLIMTTLFAPLALIGCFLSAITKSPSESLLKMKSCCEEFSKRHGLAF